MPLKWENVTSDPQWAEADSLQRETTRRKYFDRYKRQQIADKYGEQSVERAYMLFSERTAESMQIDRGEVVPTYAGQTQEMDTSRLRPFDSELATAEAATTGVQITPTELQEPGGHRIFPNVIQAGLEQTTPGMAYLLAGGRTGLPEDYDPTRIENLASGVIGMVADPVFYMTFGIGSIAAKAVGKAAMKRAGTGIAAKAIQMEIGLGGAEAIHYPMRQKLAGEEYDPVEHLKAVSRSMLTGGAAGAAGAIGKLPAEIAAFGTAAPVLERRTPTADDYIDATAIILGIKAIHGVSRVVGKGLRKLSRGEKLTPEEVEIISDIDPEQRIAIAQKVDTEITKEPTDAERLRRAREEVREPGVEREVRPEEGKAEAEPTPPERVEAEVTAEPVKTAEFKGMQEDVKGVEQPLFDLLEGGKVVNTVIGEAAVKDFGADVPAFEKPVMKPPVKPEAKQPLEVKNKKGISIKEGNEYVFVTSIRPIYRVVQVNKLIKSKWGWYAELTDKATGENIGINARSAVGNFQDGNINRLQSLKDYPDLKPAEAVKVKAEERVVEPEPKIVVERVEPKQVEAERPFTEREIIKRRRKRVQAVRDHFGLTDAQLRTITKQDIRLMTDWDFKQFIDKVEIKAVEVQKRSEAKAAVMGLIREKRFVKWQNLQKAQKLPPIDKMSTEQLGKFLEALEDYLPYDEFLSVRKLETVDKTDLKGIKTIREARERLAKDLNIPIEGLETIAVSELDRVRYDTALARRNPFYNRLVSETIESGLRAQRNYLDVEKEINRLAKASRKSRKRKLVERAVPQDKKVFEYLDAPIKEKPDLLKDMTSQELDYAHYVESKASEAYTYLAEQGVLKSTRFEGQYITHIRKGMLESIKDDGLRAGVKSLFERYRHDEQIFNILDRDTGNILPLEKFFRFKIFRTGKLEPTKNVAKAFLAYQRNFEMKRELDRIVPKLDIYVYALQPVGKTGRGLLYDQSLKKFFNEWMNTKRGRRVTLLAKQGGKLDLTLRAFNALVTIKDLAFNIPVQVAATVGESGFNYIMLGKKSFALGLIRKRTQKGRKILREFKEFTGKSVWEEMSEASNNIGDKLSGSMFALFHHAMTEANKTYLLGSLTKEEFKSGKISDGRLADMKKTMGEYRYVEGAGSIIGATPEAKVYLKYKTWAVPALSTTIYNLKKAVTGKINAKEAWQIYRSVELVTTVLLVGSYISSDDRTLLGAIRRKLYREALSVLGATNPLFWLAMPRLVSWNYNLIDALSKILRLERYKKTGELKGVVKLKREVTPRAVGQFIIRPKSRSGTIKEFKQRLKDGESLISIKRDRIKYNKGKGYKEKINLTDYYTP